MRVSIQADDEEMKWKLENGPVFQRIWTKNTQKQVFMGIQRFGVACHRDWPETWQELFPRLFCLAKRTGLLAVSESDSVDTNHLRKMGQNVKFCIQSRTLIAWVGMSLCFYPEESWHLGQGKWRKLSCHRTRSQPPNYRTPIPEFSLVCKFSLLQGHGWPLNHNLSFDARESPKSTLLLLNVLGVAASEFEHGLLPIGAVFEFWHQQILSTFQCSDLWKHFWAVQQTETFKQRLDAVGCKMISTNLCDMFSHCELVVVKWSKNSGHFDVFISVHDQSAVLMILL